MKEADVQLCRSMAAFFAGRGYNPLPSRTDDKRPMMKYADLWEKELPIAEFDRFQTTNLQIMCGRHWGLLVIDLDGPEAIERWATMGRTPKTWVSHSGGGGRHLWFSVRQSFRPLPKAFLWKGEGKHQAIERLCDHSLVMAPPSIHPKTGRRYMWLDKWNSPKTLPLPALCPMWVLQIAPIEAPRPILPAPPAVRLRWRDTVESIADIPSLVRSWGIKTVGQPRSSGWISCHAFDRDDARPSAAVHSTSGYYVDSGSGLRLGLLDLAVALNIYATAQEAITDLGGKYGRCG